MEYFELSKEPGKARSLIETLEQLRSEYAATLPAKIDEVTAAASGLDLDSTPVAQETALADLRNLAHKLAGSGATFGFTAMGRRARNLEHLADSAMETPSGITDAVRSKIRESVADLRNVAARGVDTAIGASVPAVATLDMQQPDLEVDQERPILLVEDDDDLAAQLQAELENFGFDVTVLGRPGDVHAALLAREYTCVVMDMVFDGNDQIGIETVRDLRAAGALTQPVIFLSGRTDARARLAAVRAGGDAYLTKPVGVTELVDTLDRHTGSNDTEPYRILIIDDDPAMAAYSEAVLAEAGMITMTLTEPLGVLEAIEAFSPELILLDLYMQACSGTELAMMIRQNLALAGLPIVFLSNESETASQLDAMRRGGDDFLTKSMQPDHLVTAVVLRATRFRALRALMVRDSLTGLLDHSATKQALETEIARAQRNGDPLTFALLDIDHFKLVNDRHGHQVGDWVIKSIARLLKQRLRGVDIIGRMGGEEFAVVLTGADSVVAREVFDQIRIAFSEIVHRSESEAFQVTFSCGLAEYPQYGSAAMLTAAADKALYEAKRGGRNRVVVNDTPVRESIVQKLC